MNNQTALRNEAEAENPASLDDQRQSDPGNGLRVTSLTPEKADAKKLLELVCEHRKIENGLHSV